MNDRIDDFISGLQERIFEETRAAYGEVGFQRWRKPLYRGVMDDADGYGRLTGTCGDTMQIFLKFEKERVKAATYLTDGCGSSGVCGSLAAELSLGKTPDELMDFSGEKILDVLGVFPEEDKHCAFLAAETVQDAIGDFMKKRIKQDRR
ncbi:MAG: iron-sulfur cluster assembly scaffold protein [Pseudomonadota bacterium]